MERIPRKNGVCGVLRTPHTPFFRTCNVSSQRIGETSEVLQTHPHTLAVSRRLRKSVAPDTPFFRTCNPVTRTKLHQ